LNLSVLLFFLDFLQTTSFCCSLNSFIILPAFRIAESAT